MDGGRLVDNDHDRLVRIETKLDTLLLDYKERIALAIKRDENTERRLSGLEKSIGVIIGISGVIGGLIASAIHWLIGKF